MSQQPHESTAPGGRDVFLVSNSVDELGGVTTWSHQMARLLTDRGHRVHVVGIAPVAEEIRQKLPADLPYATTTLYDAHPPKARRLHGIKGRLNAPERRRQAVRRAGMRDRAETLSGLFRAARPGGVVIVTQVWAMEWVALADTKGLSVIGMSHESFEASQKSTRGDRVRRHYSQVDRLLVLTPEDADLWIRAGMENVDSMPNPLPFMPDSPAPRTSKVVASVGRLAFEKGVDLLLDAWADAAPHHPDWTLRIHGAGIEEESLRAHCASLGLDDSVEWMGSTDDVLGALRGASVFAQASRAEGFPITLLEAMAAGLPVAAFDCAPGVREIVEHGEDGLLARLGNTMELAGHLDALMSDADLRDRLGDAGFRSVRRFSSDEITDRWEALFAFLDR
ncbi:MULTISPECIES: glycosyltransferase [unclassified Streptomyces]|uniref:glycosyltransferase n=1 Tax=unclassified Streptomyces TaxID=2593676 RepID=UPI002481F740|nr:MULTISPECIES: glycosyltransferase [unclassified Streptomyces]MDA5282241.1 glycosyltransferase [Streptomyces sp. Isolate_45]MDX2395485.1 glycosyltransferase [Streptomyces sp. DK15]